MKTQYIILDFEMNPVAQQNKEARSRLHREIIEIGAVKLDSDHNIVDKFSCYVKPRYNAEINPFIRNLTGISTWEVCTASYFEETIAQLEEWIGYDHATTVSKLCEMARNQSRVNSSEKPIENEKYAFRCFLLRLGFIGAEYKTARKILLKNLSGSSAFRNGGTQHEISE